MSEQQTVRVHNHCPFCATANYFTVPKIGMELYILGSHVQDAFPDMSPERREILLTGTCYKCQDEIFVEESEDTESESTEDE